MNLKIVKLHRMARMGSYTSTKQTRQLIAQMNTIVRIVENIR